MFRYTPMHSIMHSIVPGSGSGLVVWPVFKTAMEAPPAAPVGSIPTRSRHPRACPHRRRSHPPRVPAACPDPCGAPDRGDRAAVHLLDDPLPGQRVQVPTDRHIGDIQLPGQFVDPDSAASAHLIEDQGTPLLREQILILAQPGPVLRSGRTVPRHPAGTRSSCHVAPTGRFTGQIREIPCGRGPRSGMVVTA